MPREFKIPSHTEHHCEPCEHHKCVGALYVRSGNGSYKDYECRHPSLLHVVAGTEYGRMIGRTENQPDWCPLKKV